MPDQTIPTATVDVFRRFWAVLRSANALVPGVVVVGVLIIVPLVVLVSNFVELRLAATVFIVLVVAVVIYIRRSSFGEAAIALVAGLFPALSIDWTPGKFVAFCVAWVLLAALALMIASVRLAAANESIYFDAAIALGEIPLQDASKRLRSIADSYSGLLGPVEKANVLRLLAYRSVTTEKMGKALRDVDILATVTRLDYLVAAGVVADVIRIDPAAPVDYLDSLQRAILKSSSSPTEFVAAFNQSRHAALSKSMKLTPFLDELAESLRRGLSPEQIGRSWPA